MSLRILAASIAIVAGLGFALPMYAQEGTGTTETRPKGKAAAPKGKAKSGASPIKTEKATFGGGCFWCQEAVFERLPGVKSVVSGYAGGSVPHPSYEMVGTGLTGHAEVVQIEFDPAVTTYDDLLKVFWKAHDPTSWYRQGPDEGPQYRSIILYHNEAQKKAARESYEKLTADHVFPAPIVTELVPLKTFYPAERYHQNYYRRHLNDPYSEAEIAPKLRKLKLK